MPQLPARPSLEHLRKQAKRRRREDGGTLAVAQRRLAVAYGFASWPRLVRHVRATGLVGLARALALADADALAAHLTAHPGAAREPVHADDVALARPLVVLLRDSLGAPADVRRCAELLLEAGADPGGTVPSDDGEWQLTCLSLAVERSDLTLVRLLTGAGAPPDDDAFYHACEQAGPALLDALYAPGFETMINHKLDFEDAAGLRWFLDRDVDLDRHGCLHWAIGRGRGVAILQLLLDAGADPRLPHPDVGITPLEAAARCGHLAAFELLRARGVDDAVTPVADAVLAVAQGRSTRLPDEPPPLPGFPEPGPTWLLGQLAQLGRTDVVRALVASGVPVDARGWSGFTPLDQAAMHGRLETVRVLVEHGADLEDTAFDEEYPTPLDCAVWGWSHNRAPDGDYEGTVELLVRAGAPTLHEPPTGNPRIDVLLTDR